MEEPSDHRERAVREAWDAGNFDRATELTLRRYGGEVFGFLLGLHRDQDDADDAFSDFAERVWTNMPRFGWKCSLRTWVYLLARSASTDVLRRRARDVRQRGASPHDPRLSQIAAEVRTETLSLLRTAKRAAIDELTQSLSHEERELLILRAARSLPWRDIALVLADGSELEERALEQECARLRKRYQLLKNKLRELGRDRGLL